MSEIDPLRKVLGDFLGERRQSSQTDANLIQGELSFSFGYTSGFYAFAGMSDPLRSSA